MRTRRNLPSTVLVIESEPRMRTLACRLLQQGGYKVLSASTQAEALVLATHSGYDVDLLLSHPDDARIAQRLSKSRRPLQVVCTMGERATLLATVQQLLESAPNTR